MTHWLKYGPLFLLLGMPVLTEVSACNANIDADGDGYASDIDCNDEDASIHPEAVEVCDNIDQDCDGEIDEELAQTTHYPDADGDGYGDDASPVDACVAPPGTVSNGSDCDDGNTSIHPEAVEVCDNIDQDCDGEVDEDVVRIYYVDADGDGYGDETLGASCLQTETSITRGGDCDDDNASSYPAAPDTAGDGIDQSCDGTDGLAPSVGLPGSSFTSIQAALGAASDGQTVWVGPGTYPESNLSMGGKGLQLRSTEGPEKTILDAQSKAPVMLFYAGETERSVLEGFTLTGGKGKNGGGMWLYYSSPTLSNVTFTGNTAYYGSGGGMYLYESSPALKNVTFTGNSAWGYEYDGSNSGGGMSLYNSSPTLSNVTFTENTAHDGLGGGMYLSSSSPTLSNVTFTGNTAFYGGGMGLHESSPTLSSVTFTGNTTHYLGGGMYLDDSSPTLKNVTFTGNTASGSGSGGGMYLWYSSPTLSNVTFTGNTAEDDGGGMWLSSSSPTLSNVTFTGNTAEDGSGGGMYLSDSSPTLSNVILAYNNGLNLYVSSGSDSGTPVLSYTNLYQGYGPSHNLTSLPPTVTELEPRFVSFSPDGDPSNDDLHLQPSSPLRDAGDPRFCTDSNASGCDPDGSLPDLGAYGGPQADFSGYQDSDQDGLYDSWELALAGNLTTLSGALDADADGLSDEDELKAGTSPLMTDSDADGSSDGNEVAAGKDPLNPSSVPGVEGLVALQVPSSAYPTLQAALNAIPAGREGYVKLAAGTVKENLTLSQKSVTVEGAGEGQTVLDGQQHDSVWKVVQAELNLSGVTVQNGKANDGGGMWLYYSSPTLSNVTFTGNTAYDGGGMWLYYSSPTLSNVTFTGNTAYDGGGMYLRSSSPTLSNVTFTGNSAEDGYGGGYGGGMYLSYSSPTLSNVTFTGNTADDGGGMYLSDSSPTLKNVILAYNRASYGGNFYKYGSSSSVKATTSLFYNPSGWGTDNLTPTGTYLTVEPKFLDYADTRSGASCTPGTSTTCLPADLHPAPGSPLIDAGDPAMSDVDGSRADIGSYGGPGGGSWDVDADGAPDYFWPGEWDNAPSGFDPADYDCDDLDPDVQGC